MTRSSASIGRLMLVALGGCLLAVLTAAPAVAHGDERIVDERIVLAPGGSATFTGEVHYHRLVGRVLSDGPVVVRFAPADPTESVADGVAMGPAVELRFNELIRCCDDDGWTPYRLVIENAGDEAVTVVAHVGLVHDDLAVMVDGAESGTRVSLVVAALGWAALVLRASRRSGPGIPLRRSAVGLIALTAVVVGLARWGANVYGGAGVPLLAAASDVPVLPINLFVSRASLILAGLMLVWGAVALWWVRARPAADRRRWQLVGVGLLGLVGWAALRMAFEYGAVAIAMLWAAIPMLPLVWLAVIGVPSRASEAMDVDRRSDAPAN